MDPIYITAHTATSALGHGLAEHLEVLRMERSGLRENDFSREPLTCAIGRVIGLEQRPLPEAYAAYECRNNRLAWLGIEADGFLDQARAAIGRYGADRVALLVATSTSSIGATEEAYARLEDGHFPENLRRSPIHTPHSLGIFLEHALGTRGPCLTTATACSSSAKIFATAERMIRLGIVDAAILAGVDSLCGSVLFGFNSLELVAPEPCRPFDVRRRGISIGEAAGFALVEREVSKTSPKLIGWGESSDAHHMSTPHPEGLGARLALEGALTRAGIAATDVDYINLHGTATTKNDEVEAGVVSAAFNARTRASSTKGWSGHTLGAAGILESVICLLVMEHGLIPGTLNCEQPDPVCGPQLALRNESADVRIALTNSFGFGGSNCTLAFACGGRS
ncbi:MAG: beta-ketoacyl-[acyl-carrier-protein] synthase family protein [Xanthomonadales bacterium]|nr:beta-ketoacyl-[acyl-carrier-protein] synthase family protein [Xanthomonadales bacterium]